ncbi:MAG: hypothetical protein K9N11_08470 [Lentisphaeria bacterium]|nr:hypothetical protein [Candidatus Neomarinimicrobiota bacterium]MCF7842870.1 hypothetical protein [Lentisphaeria bacterium]
MQNDWWLEIVKWLLLAVVFIFIGIGFRRYGFRVRPSPDGTTLKQPVSVLMAGVVGFIFWGGITVISNTIARNETTTLWSTAIFVFLALMSLVLIAYYFFARHHLSPEGLAYGKLYGKREFIRWSDIREIKYKPRRGWFRLQTAAGSGIRISVALLGLPEFAQHILAHVSPERLDNPTRSLLMEIAAGKKPESWK